MIRKLILVGLLVTLLFPVVSGELTGFEVVTRDGKGIQIFFEEDDGCDGFEESNKDKFSASVKTVIILHNLSYILENRTEICKEITVLYENGSWEHMSNIRIAQIQYHNENGNLITEDWEETWYGWLWIIIVILFSSFSLICIITSIGVVSTDGLYDGDAVETSLIGACLGYVAMLPFIFYFYSIVLISIVSGIFLAWGIVLGIYLLINFRASSKKVTVEKPTGNANIREDAVILDFYELEKNIKTSKTVCNKAKKDLLESLKKVNSELEKSKNFSARLEELKIHFKPPVRDIGEGRILHFRKGV